MNRISQIPIFYVGRKVLTNERHEAIIIRRVTKLLHQRIGLLLGKLLTEVSQQSEQFMGQHRVVFILVVKLQNFNEVVESSLVLTSLAVDVHGEGLLLRDHLPALLSAAPDVGDGLQGRVEVAGPHQVSGKECINFAITFEVINIEGEVYR